MSTDKTQNGLDGGIVTALQVEISRRNAWRWLLSRSACELFK